MRNLKKVLSLALAMVMLLGMMVVGAGAATEFKDADSIKDNRKVAVAVASALEVLLGDENGNFNPEATLTRAEAAVVLAKLDLGADAAKALTATNAASFDDVGTGYGWAKPFIDYCAGNGYMIGVGNNRFAPAKTLTSVEFATMISRVLGYRDANEYGQEGWSAVKAAALARKAGLGTDVAVANADMSRADMAQMVLNALTAPMVEYEGLNISIDNVAITSKATVRLHDITLLGSGETYNGEAVTATTPIRLCEEKYPTLKLDTTVVDDFGETSQVWKVRGAEVIGSESEIEPDMTFYGKITKDTPEWARISSLTPSTPANTKNGKTYESWINGFQGTYGAAADKTWLSDMSGRGREMKVYLNKFDMSKVDKVVIKDTALATVYKVESDTIKVKLEKTALEAANKKDSSVEYYVQGGVVLTSDKDETAVYDNPKVGDVVLVQGYCATTPIIGKTEKKAITTLTSVELAEQQDLFITTKRWDSKDAASYLLARGDDTKYKDAFNVVENNDVNSFEPNAQKYDSTLILDKYGNIMKAIEGVDPNATSDKLIAVAEVYRTLLDNKLTTMVKGVISNGETVNWPLKDGTSASPNSLYTYSTENDRYILESVKEKPTTSTSDTSTHVANVWSADKSVSFKTSDVFGKENGANYLLADNVKFIFVNAGEITVANGRQSYDFTGKVLAQAMRKNAGGNLEISAVFIMAEPDVADISDLIFVSSINRETTFIKELEDGTQVKQYGYTAYDANGEEIENFLGVNDTMADMFVKKDLDKYGAHKKNTTAAVVTNYTQMYKDSKNVPIYVSKVNGKAGDAFTLNNGMRFISNNTKVVDLSDCGRDISSVAELNEAVNDGYGNTQVAVIFNRTEGDNGTVLLAKTVFVVDCKKGDGISNPEQWVDPKKPGGQPDVVGEYTMKAPANVLYSLDKKDWDSQINITGKVDEVIYMKPADGDFFFTDAPNVSGGYLNGKATVSADGVNFKITITTALTDDVIGRDVGNVKLAKLTDSYVDTSTAATSKIYLRFEKAGGGRATSSDLTGVTGTMKAEIIAQELAKKGYTDISYDASFDFTFKDGYKACAIDESSNAYIDCIRYYAGTRTAANLKLATAGDTINVGTGAAVVYDKDGELVRSEGNASSITYNADLDDCLIVAKAKADPAEKTANTKKPTAERDETIKIESSNNTDKTGFLTQDSDAYGGAEADYDYSKATGKLTTATLQIAAANSDAQIRITQTNDALKIVPDGRKESETVRVTTLDATAITTEAPDSHSSVIEYEYLVMEGGGTITIKVERWKTGESTLSAAPTVYTITIDPSTMTFK